VDQVRSDVDVVAAARTGVVAIGALSAVARARSFSSTLGLMTMSGHEKAPAGRLGAGDAGRTSDQEPATYEF
jgi:hypothetical protein